MATNEEFHALLRLSISRVPTVTIDETLALVGSSISAIDDSSAPASSEEALLKELESLADKSYLITQHKKNLRKALNKLDTDIQHIRMNMLQLRRNSVLPDALIHFVTLLEAENHYFDFKKSAKQAYDFKSTTRVEIFDTLFADQQLKSKFSMIGEMEISQASYAIYFELNDEKNGTDRMYYVLTDWIRKLVFRTREKGYVMNQDPIVELKTMMKFEPYVYDGYFVNNKLPVKCTEKSTEEARNKYSQLVSKMHSEYKEAVEEKHKFRIFEEKLPSTAATASRLKRKSVWTDGKARVALRRKSVRTDGKARVALRLRRKSVRTDGKVRVALRENRMSATPSNFGG